MASPSRSPWPRCWADLWHYDLDGIRTRVPDLWDHHDDVLEMPDDGRIVVVLGLNDRGSVVKLSTARNGDCTDTDLRQRSMLLVPEAGPPIAGVDANGRRLALVAPEAAGE